jgi:hypothetical protein
LTGVDAAVTSIRISAVRTGEERDRVYVNREDGSEVWWSWIRDELALPHDLEHWVVETGARLTHGFWGLVADGLDPTRVNKMADRIASGVTLRDMSGRDTTELIQAESLTAAVGQLRFGSAEQAIVGLAEACDRFGVEPPPVRATDLTTMEGRANDLQRAWFGTPEGTALELEFPNWEA